MIIPDKNKNNYMDNTTVPSVSEKPSETQETINVKAVPKLPIKIMKPIKTVTDAAETNTPPISITVDRDSTSNESEKTTATLEARKPLVLKPILKPKSEPEPEDVDDTASNMTISSTATTDTFIRNRYKKLKLRDQIY